MAVDHKAEMHFYALADELSLNMAARRCGVSRQTILSSLTKVECEYGAALVQLERKRPTLTKSGKRLRDSLREVGIDESNDETICIMEDSFSEHEITRWLSASAAQLWPSTNVQILRGDYQKALADPTADYFDLAFVFGWPRIRHPDWKYTKLYDEEVNAFLPRHVLNSESGSIGLKTLRRYTHFVPSDAMPGLSDLLLWESRRSGCQSTLKTVSNKRTFCSLILAGRGVGFAPANSIQAMSPSMVRIPFESRITIPLVAIHRKHEPAKVVHRLLNLACRLTDAGRGENVATCFPDEKHGPSLSASCRHPHSKKPRRHSMTAQATVTPARCGDLLQPSIPPVESSPII